MALRKLTLSLATLFVLLALAACDNGPVATPTPTTPAAPTTAPVAQIVIRFQTTGGIAGVTKTIVINPGGSANYNSADINKTGTVDPGKYSALLQQVKTADFFNLKDNYDNGNVSDDFYYNIIVKQEGKSKTVQVAAIGGKDLTPPALQDFITQLNDIQTTLEK